MRHSPDAAAQPIIPVPESEKNGAQVDELRSKVSTLNDKLDASKSKTMGAPQTHVISEAIVAQPGEGNGAEIQTSLSSRDPETGFINDEAIETYKKAMILFEAHKYPEAVLAFSGFLEKYADHPLAGTAQFYVGESYFQQKELKLAYQEYQRVLTSYDRSPHITQTLKRLAQVEESLSMNEAAAKHRQMLLSMFPQSPAAADNSGDIKDMAVKEMKEEKQVEQAPPVAAKVEEMEAPAPTKMSAAEMEPKVEPETDEKAPESKKLDEAPVPTAPMPSTKTSP